MIKLKNKMLNETDFVQAFGYLRNQNSFPVKTAWHISCMGQKLETVMKQSQEAFQKMLKKHAVLDEKGEVAPVLKDLGNGKTIPQHGTWVIKDECKEDFEKDFAEFLDIEHEFNRPLLKLDDLKDAKLSPQQLGALSPIIQDLELV